MSRALDPSTASSIAQTNQHQDVYASIATVLSPSPPTVLEIEFLGKSHPLPAGTHYLQDGNNIAIPKTKLVQAFIHARHLFFDELKPRLECEGKNHDEILRATAVMLLMDPEQLTAANSRKRILNFYRQQGESSAAEFESRCEREFLFLDGYLTSRLHRHTKSPTLWSHRRWLLGIMSGGEKAGERELQVQKGLDVVLVAAERHPRNYYAWLHLRWLVLRAGKEVGEGEKVLERVKEWCLKHPGDTSGFSFLGFYLDLVVEKQARLRIFREVLGLARSFKWTHESVWVFLRTIVAADNGEEESIAFVEVNTFLVGTNRGDAKATKVLQSATEWYQNNRRLSRQEEIDSGSGTLVTL